MSDPAAAITDTRSMTPSGHGPMAVYDSQRDFSLKSFRSACYAPFVSLDFFTTGQVQVCCENYFRPVGNVKTDSLKAIWTGQAIQHLREALKRYDFGLGCQTCETAILRGGRPFSLNYEWHPADEANPWPRIMNFRLSNVCNFACVMCSDLLSSVIRRDRTKQHPLPRVYHEAFFQELWKFLPHLESMWFAGGEPFLIQEHLRIWDQLIQTGNTNVHVAISTNGSIWNDAISNYLDRLALVHLLISIDGATKETFEKVRIGANFDVVMENLKHFAPVVKKTRLRGSASPAPGEFSFAYCLMPINAHEMPDVFLMAEDWGADVYVNVVTIPESCTFMSRPPDEILQAHSSLRKAFDRIQPRLSKINAQRYLQACTTVLGMAQQLREQPQTQTVGLNTTSDLT